eukprot:9727954-Karenia_brevis.AAC.1
MGWAQTQNGQGTGKPEPEPAVKDNVPITEQHAGVNAPGNPVTGAPDKAQSMGDAGKLALEILGKSHGEEDVPEPQDAAIDKIVGAVTHLHTVKKRPAAAKKRPASCIGDVDTTTKLDGVAGPATKKTKQDAIPWPGAPKHGDPPIELNGKNGTLKIYTDAKGQKYRVKLTKERGDKAFSYRVNKAKDVWKDVMDYCTHIYDDDDDDHDHDDDDDHDDNDYDDDDDDDAKADADAD